ncbi:protein kinase [Sorangium sp. So ce448]|uniref:serine/threonine-protein kinase n=1 Tax=Sorangium sp. So ce448 TaxID=3133314 RepID=UPI003F5DA73A
MSRLKAHTPAGRGVTINDKYRLVEKIGEGAMGSVWSAINLATGREVALKRMIRAEPELRIRFEREARSCGALQHRNIVDVYDMVETDAGELFLVMQLLSGETLADLLVRRRRVEPDVGAGIGRDIARGLAAAHELHIVHRDLKPANIFLHREAGVEGWVVKVLDFGVAKNLSINDGLHTIPGGAIGSPLYMSPEQVRADRTIDHRTDIWTLGVVLFEMLAGERPFRGNTTEVFAGILAGEIPPLSRILWRVDRRLVDIVARCTRPNPEERFGTAAEVAELLDEIATAGGALPSAPGSTRDVPEAEPPQPAARQLSVPPVPQISSGESAGNATDAARAAPGHRKDPGSSTTPLVTSSSQVNLAAGTIPPGAPGPSRHDGSSRRNVRIATAVAVVAFSALVAAVMVMTGRHAVSAAAPPAVAAPQAVSGSPVPPLQQRSPETRVTAPGPGETTSHLPAPAPPGPAPADGSEERTPADGASVAPEPPSPAPTSKQRVDAPSDGKGAQRSISSRPPASKQAKADPCAGKTGFLRALCRDREKEVRNLHDSF